jgi:hypothetical protein
VGQKRNPKENTLTRTRNLGARGPLQMLARKENRGQEGKTVRRTIPMKKKL